MGTKLVFFLVAMATLHLSSAQLNDAWIKTVYEIGAPITLNCSEYCENAADNGCHPESPIPDEYWGNIVSWLGPAPDLFTWPVDNSSSSGITNISRAECPSCEILHDGWQFKINHFDPSYHIGIYHCMLYNETTRTYFMVKWGVNMKGPYFEDLLTKYENNIIYGVSAFGAFLFVAFTILLVYKYRWIPEEEEGKTYLPTTQNNYGTNNKVGVDSPVFTNGIEGKLNNAFEAESEIPPKYNGVETEVEVHSMDAVPGPSSSSSSGSDTSSIRRRELEEEATHF